MKAYFDAGPCAARAQRRSPNLTSEASPLRYPVLPPRVCQSADERLVRTDPEVSCKSMTGTFICLLTSSILWLQRFPLPKLHSRREAKMSLTPEDQAVETAALKYVRENRRELARRLTNPAIYPAEKSPVAVFMAGSPGAGKTEASQALIAELGGPVLRIDPDDYRNQIPGYNGRNSNLFQRAVGNIVEKVLDDAFKKGQSFILDGTLSNYDVAFRNINRALNKNRLVQILYVFQEPCQAWRFVKDREALDGRSVPITVFIDQYFSARDVVNRLKRELGSKIKVDLIIKNLDGGNRVYEGNIQTIDGYVREIYNVRSLREALGTQDGS